MPSEADIFLSVFGASSAVHTTPTPQATPSLGEVGYGQSFGGPATPARPAQSSTAAQLQVRRNLAWSTVTRYLSLDSLKFETIVHRQKHSLRPKRHSREVEEALDLLLNMHHETQGHEGQWDIFEWFAVEVRTHFLSVVAPQLAKAWSQPIPLGDQSVPEALGETIRVLAEVQEQYMSRVESDLVAKMHASSDYDNSVGINFESLRKERRNSFRRKVHALFLHAFPQQRLASALSWFMYSHICALLSVSGSGQENSADELFTLLGKLDHVGLGYDFGQRAFANAMWKVLDDFLTGHHMKVNWDRSQSKIKTLMRFLSHGFVPLIEKCITILGGTPDDVCQYRKMAIQRLARNRINNLFDYIVHWDRSLGAVRDIKEYIDGPESRQSLTASFSEQVKRRLLHAGVTTTHILNLYINIIHAFNELDPKGVLLTAVAKPIRHYLLQREDTARVIVASLLAEVNDDGKVASEPAMNDISTAIAKEMTKPILGLEGDEDQNMNFDDMEWTPDPVDAGPEYKRSKNQDVLSALLSLYNRDEFINELKTILGDHLLRQYDKSEHFEKEERLLELFKHRLGEDKLQACEVMLRDVQSSQQMNKTIQHSSRYQDTYSKLGNIDMYTHILSSYFWPSLRDDEFKIPEPVRALRTDYEAAFEAVKDTRKLRWMTALGRATVELEFEDRKVEEEVPTWTASVIYAFASDGNPAPRKTADELEEELEMDASLVRSALAYWRSKQVLREVEADTYTVIENLSELSTTEQEGQAPALMDNDPAVSAVRSQQELLDENAELYKTFIVGMLTNQGNMPLMRIFMMLKVVVPGGFAFGMEEVQSLLEILVTEGKIIGQGTVYGVRR